jgi:hypothetical protein
MNDETNDVLDDFCSGSYEARQFQLESEGVDAPLGRGRIRRLVRGKRLPDLLRGHGSTPGASKTRQPQRCGLISMIVTSNPFAFRSEQAYLFV